MAKYFVVFAAAYFAVSAAPPAAPRLYQQHAPAQLQQINPLDYYLDNSEVSPYYSQAQQKPAGISNNPNGHSARLETLEPDSEVELIPGAQTPQQPPQQPPVAPNIPGLLPGQRVFIVHMPVPGYRPGTIGGYQPVYIVAAAPQGNTGFPANGYQNAVFLDPSGQVVGQSPLVGYQRAVAGVPQAGNPGLILGAPLALNRPFDLAYQDPAAPYQPGPVLQGADGNRGTVRLSQLVGIQAQPLSPVANARPIVNDSPAASKGQNQASANLKDNAEEQRNARPSASQNRKA
ncbi:uncharacterized protein LOC115445659 [Manduca sexta]|uniref:Cuticle protein n=1 Tax=Manduca sexta TaxID=7130 RepID=A0A921Z9I2_MANSE|nr:uncharacterized protein LOC115445659 [Manduca sexta]KAG6453533.1 hypothetical protein O3G_MSEX008206 [Manduca sexta]